MEYFKFENTSVLNSTAKTLLLENTTGRKH